MLIDKYLQKDDSDNWNLIPPVSLELLRNINCHKFVLFVIGAISRDELLTDPKTQKANDPTIDFTFGKKALAISQKEFTSISNVENLLNVANKECQGGKAYVGQILDAKTGELAHSFIVEKNSDRKFVCFEKTGFKHYPFNVHGLESLLDFVNEKGEKSYQDQKWRFVELNTYPEEKIFVAIHRIFPQATISSVLKFSKGLASNVYKVEIRDPSKILAVKFFPKKIELRVEKSSRISSYVKENGLPSPQIYELIKGDSEGSVVMDCLLGEVASEVWETASVENRQMILVNSGKMLKMIHDLKIPSFWIHQKHEVASPEEWVEWTRVRIQKYLAAAQENLDKEIIDFLRAKFARLQDLYKAHPEFRFVPLHWDYHFSNINIDGHFEISGVFDFDNAMKGHDMADLGQTFYWLVTQQKISKVEMSEKFFTGYGELSSLDREFVYLHFLLFLAGVTRSTWPKENLKWLNELHVGVLKECLKGGYCIHTPAIL